MHGAVLNFSTEDCADLQHPKISVVILLTGLNQLKQRFLSTVWLIRLLIRRANYSRIVPLHGTMSPETVTSGVKSSNKLRGTMRLEKYGGQVFS